MTKILFRPVLLKIIILFSLISLQSMHKERKRKKKKCLPCMCFVLVNICISLIFLGICIIIRKLV